MAPLSQTRGTLLLAIGLLAGQLLLMSGAGSGRRGASLVERAVIRVSAPLVALGRLGGGSVAGSINAARELFAARARNAVLEAERIRLSGELDRLRESEREGERLRRLLGMRDELVPGSTVARVVARRFDPATRMVVLDRGWRDGVRVEQAVVAWGGAVGRVVSVAHAHSKVRLLTDPNSGVAGIVQRSRAEGNVDGLADGGLVLRYVERFADVLHGDRVVTSGLEGIFPRGFGIGRVSSIEEHADGTRTIRLEPELDATRLEEVLIVTEPALGSLLDPGPGEGER